jgi:tRNA (guanine10-N2)-dimethyltransferase
MKYLFELSKDHKKLSKDEVISCLKAEKINYKLIKSNEDIILIDTTADLKKIIIIANRLSSVFFIDRFLFSCPPNHKDIQKKALENKVTDDGTIAIKYRNRSSVVDSKTIVEGLADVYSKNRLVHLDNPEIEIRAVITNSLVYVGIKIFKIKRSQFEDRKVQFRPFFSPISLHPKLARTLVNLSLIKKGERLLDPFCGTGGILLEAGLIGAKVIGTDIELKMIDGCKKTLEHYNVNNYELHNLDIGNISKNLDKIDAVVTDFPYGKSTTTKGENPKLLYHRAFESISKVLKKKGILVAGLPNSETISIGHLYLKILDIYEVKAHKSLTRYFVKYQK